MAARRIQFEMIGPEMAEVLRQKTPAERLAIASQMYDDARRILISHLRHSHPDWTEQEVVREASRRLSHGAV